MFGIGKQQKETSRNKGKKENSKERKYHTFWDQKILYVDLAQKKIQRKKKENIYVENDKTTTNNGYIEGMGHLTGNPPWV